MRGLRRRMSRSHELASWMMLRVKLLQPFASDMGVDLRRRYIRVPEQDLHDTKIGAVIEEMRCEGMPQRVRRNGCIQRGARSVAFDELPERLPRHGLSASRHEKIVGDF